MPESNARLTVGVGAHQVPMTVKLPSFVLISRDTIHLELKNFESRIAKKYYCGTAFSVFLSSVSVVLTATQFGDFLGVPGTTWHGIFIVFAVISFVVGIGSAWMWYRHRKEMSTEYALTQMCSTSELPGPVTFSTPAVPVDFGNSASE